MANRKPSSRRNTIFLFNLSVPPLHIVLEVQSIIPMLQVVAKSHVGVYVCHLFRVCSVCARWKRCGIKCCAHMSLTPFGPLRWRNSFPRHPSCRIISSFIPAVNAPSITLSRHATLRTGLPQTRVPNRHSASRSFCRLPLLYHVGSSVTSISPPHCAPST